ncbi:MAG: tRNA uridine-5-carboxymethylaminomethyl(34) synthesis GTPase MnmE, partial [Pedobacter sp.]
MYNQDTIIALSTPPGSGAIGVIRLSGPDAINLTNQVFAGKDLTKQASHTLHFGLIKDQEIMVDEVVAGLYVAPRSYT